MPILDATWSAAAGLTGRLDLSALVAANALDALQELDTNRLRLSGLREPLVERLLQGAPTPSDQPWLTLAQDAYPPLLRGAPFAPAVLFHEGSLDHLDAPCVAIVGSRRSTPGGRRFAANLAGALASVGATVISGLAYGIDAAAHEAAGARTVAVLGQGLGVPLSGDARRRAGALRRAGGTLVSEFLPGTNPNRFTFPQRNRVIAGLAHATVVVEAAERSGALITARLAADLGREVWAVPGCPWNPTSTGCLALLRSGAQLLTDPQDLLDALGLKPVAPATQADQLMGAIGRGCTFDELVSRLDTPAQELSLELTRRVLRGQLERLPGDRYAPRAARRPQ